MFPIGRDLEIRIGRAAGIGQPQREHGRLVVSADLGRQPVPSFLDSDPRGHAIDVDLPIGPIRQHFLAIPKNAMGAHRPYPDGRLTPPSGFRTHEGRRISANLFGRAEEVAEVHPAIAIDVGRGSPADRALLAVVDARGIDRLVQLELGQKLPLGATSAFVVEGADDDPAIDHAQPSQLRLRAREIAAPAPRVGIEDARISTHRGAEARILLDARERLFDEERVALIPGLPKAAQRRVRLDTFRTAQAAQGVLDGRGHRQHVGAGLLGPSGAGQNRHHDEAERRAAQGGGSHAASPTTRAARRRTTGNGRARALFSNRQEKKGAAKRHFSNRQDTKTPKKAPRIFGLWRMIPAQ